MYTHSLALTHACTHTHQTTSDTNVKLGFKSEGQVLPDNIPQTDLMNIIKVRLQAGVVGVVGYAGREGGRHRTGGVVGEEKTRSRGG